MSQQPAKTCLIVGAGASSEYGYPLGDALPNLVAEKAENWETGWCHEKDLPYYKKHAASLAKKLRARSGGIETIDFFLSEHSRSSVSTEEERTATLEERAIALMLIAHIMRKHEEPNRRLGWYDDLYEQLKAAERDNLKWPLAIITFNYDRSLEYWLAKIHSERIGKDERLSRNWLNERAVVCHAYGDVGRLPGLRLASQFTIDDFAPGYGTPTNGWEFWKGREYFETIDAQRRRSLRALARRAICRDWLNEAKYVVCLGFAYDDMNCRFLGLNRLNEHHTFFSTAWSEQDASIIRTKLAGRSFHHGEVKMGCREYLRGTQVLASALHGENAAAKANALWHP